MIEAGASSIADCGLQDHKVDSDSVNGAEGNGENFEVADY